MKSKPEMACRDLEAAKLADLSPRDRVLRTALELFYQHGIHLVGIDRIIAESGVAKMTFYRHFPSKSRLVAEYLAYKDRAWQELLARFVGDESKPALDRLLGIFDALKFAIEHPRFCGCPFIKGLAEFGPERDEPEVKQIISAHFTNAENLVAALVKQARPKDAKRLVQPILSLIHGTIIVAQSGGDADVVDKNKMVAKLILMA